MRQNLGVGLSLAITCWGMLNSPVITAGSSGDREEMDDKVFFVINKYSGKGRRTDLEGLIRTRCGQVGIQPTMEATQYAGHATELARQAAADGYLRVFAVGGDGTVNETANGLVRTPAAMGIIPTGSGNGLARHLGIPMATTKALALLAESRTVAMDALRINDQYSFNVSGVGFDGFVAGLFGQDGNRGLAGYVNIILREYPRFREFLVKGENVGLSLGASAFIVAFANSSQFGNGATIAPQASVCDGQLDLCLIRKPGWLQAIPFIVRMMTRSLDRSPLVKIVQTAACQINLEQPVAWHLDGEPCPPTDQFSVKLEPGCLSILAPAVAHSL